MYISHILWCSNMLSNKVCLFLLILKIKGLEQGIWGSYQFIIMYVETIVICKWTKYKDLKKMMWFKALIWAPCQHE